MTNVSWSLISVSAIIYLAAEGKQNVAIFTPTLHPVI